MTFNEIRANIDKKIYNDGGTERDFFEDVISASKLDPLKPLTKRMYAKAWENGHAGGYHEVLTHFCDLLEVFKDE